MIKDTGFKLCTSHCKIKQYKDKKLRNVPKADNPMLELGKHIVKKLDEKENFLEVDIVVIENQPAFKKSYNEISTNDIVFLFLNRRRNNLKNYSRY